MEVARKLQQNKFDLNDMLAQFQQIKKMGSIKQILSMLPGMDKKLRDVEVDERQLPRTEAIIQSMTPEERAKPELLNASRRKRIAAGCGQKVEDVNRLIRQFEEMQKMFKSMQKPGKRGRRGRMQLPPGFGL